MTDVVVSITERELIVRFNGLSHLRLDRRQIIGLQSWARNRGRDTPIFQIEFYTKAGSSIVADYDSRERWEAILRKLDGVTFLEEWRE